jgi:4-amino-4-deoxy-L-arabinose transferase-like glycosyltransferase
LLEGNMLSEPLGLVLLGVVLLLVADLRDHPTVVRAAIVGAVSGLLALTRPEQVVVVALIVVPLLLRVRSLSTPARLARIAVVGVVMIAVLAPWTVYNASRFKERVVLSSDSGATMLAGNCAPGSFAGARMGFWDNTCLLVLASQHPGLDTAQLDRAARDAAVDNVRDNSDRLPIVVPARVGRLLGVFRPSQTVGFVAQWMGVDTGLIWAWVASFWVILALAVGGAIVARRERTWTWPLVAPFAVVLVAMLVFNGEPRFHAMADLGLVVLAAFAIDRLLTRRRPSVAKPSRSSTRADRPAPRDRGRRLPSVHVSG